MKSESLREVLNQDALTIVNQSGKSLSLLNRLPSYWRFRKSGDSSVNHSACIIYVQEDLSAPNQVRELVGMIASALTPAPLAVRSSMMPMKTKADYIEGVIGDYIKAQGARILVELEVRQEIIRNTGVDIGLSLPKDQTYSILESFEKYQRDYLSNGIPYFKARDAAISHLGTIYCHSKQINEQSLFSRVTQIAERQWAYMESKINKINPGYGEVINHESAHSSRP